MEQKEIKDKRKLLAPFCVAAAAVLWGILVVFVRKLNEYGFGAMEIVTLRAYGSVCFLFPGLFLINKKLLKFRGKDTWCFVGTGVFSIVFFSYCYFKNVEISTASLSSILMYTSPVWVTLLSAVCFRERITKRKVLALCMAISGCVLVSGITNGPGNVSLQGILLGLGSGIGYGLYSIFGRYALDRGYHPMSVTAYTFLFACVGVLPFVRIPSILEKLNAEPMLWGIALAMALFTTAMSFTLYTIGLRYLEPGQAAVLATLEPIVSTVVGVMVYGEMVSGVMFLGIVLVLVSSIIISKS